MVSDVDQTLAHANEALERMRSRIAAPQAVQLRRGMRRMQRFMRVAALGLIATLVAAGLWSMVIGPIGIIGVTMVGLMMAMVVVGAALFSREADVRAESIGAADLPQLADRTSQYLGQQRLMLPAPAQTLSDSIAARLSALNPQLQRLEDKSIEAVELRRLVAEDLPGLISSYGRVPVAMRRENRNGRVAETELIEGMQLLDGEIDQLARQLASGDMDRLSSQKRYLEMRYKD